jgi:hypothetical protein
MKLGKLALLSAVFTVMLSAQPRVGHATQMLGATVSGAITASPSTTQIEIAHVVYAIQANSPASKVVRSFFLGQVVDAVLSAPGLNTSPQVVSLAAHAGT